MSIEEVAMRTRMCSGRILLLAVLAVTVLASSSDAWWLHHHKRYYPVPYPVVTGPVVTSRVRMSGEFYFPGAYTGRTMIGGGELFMPGMYTFGSPELYYFGPRRGNGDQQPSDRVKPEADIKKGVTPGTTPAVVPSAACAELEKRIDKLTDRIGVLEKKVDAIGAYIERKEAEAREKEMWEEIEKLIGKRLDENSATW